jgi:3-deoxy-7-phosphoheptulonate synthase
MKLTDDLRVKGYQPLTAPQVLKKEIPISADANQTVVLGRQHIENILQKKDRRLLIIVGPCSIHDEKASLEYAAKLNLLRQKVAGTLLVLMRVYFEKPRTTVGWKGMINDPHLDGSCDMTAGLRKARRLLVQINAMGLPAATEMLDTITAQYVADLISSTAIGARTSESQIHREMASGLSMPVGFKNSTDGNLSSAIHALEAARTPQGFLGIDQDGKTCVVKTTGNPWVHIVLRGGKRPNYDPISLEEARLKLIKKNLPEIIMVDCSHANSMKKYQGQPVVWKSVIGQHLDGNEALIGLRLESNLYEGNQTFSGDASSLKYGVSITDECISWEATEELLLWAHVKLQQTDPQKYKVAS